MHKKSIKGKITQKVFKLGLSFLYATHHHDLFYITVKYHQNIPNSFQVIEQKRNRRKTGSSLYPPKPFGRGIKSREKIELNNN